MRKWLLAAIFLMDFASSAAGQTMCAKISDVETQMGKVGAAAAATGAVDTKRVILIYTMPDGEWIIYIVNQAGIACVLGNGSHWSVADAPSL